MTKNLLEKDLNHILYHTQLLWEELRNQHIFITGGTGFFGCWLLESFVWANDNFNLNARATVLTRDPNQFKKKCPHLASHSAITFQLGDVRNFEFPTDSFSHIIHAATDASAHSTATHPLHMLYPILEGTKHVLEFAKYCKAPKFLLVSSGAVYGKQPEHIAQLAEDHPPSHLKSGYAIGKCAAEHISCLYASLYGFEVKIARCFAFVGPYLSLDANFAIGDFIREGLRNNPIQVNSNGTSCRSYLYAADLAIWLWTILFRGQSERFYNVGSDISISITELARLVARLTNSTHEVAILQPSSNHKMPERYIPSIQRAANELKLKPEITLPQAIMSTIKWHKHSVIPA